MMNLDSAAFTPAPATLYAVATPIGHLRDITLRALDVLRTVDFVAAEDTRVSSALLRHYGIDAKMIALHEHNERTQSRRIVDLLQQGRAVAVISDAGTPGVSDPGAELVAAVRAAGFAVVPIPGASALTTLLSVTGWRAAPFTFAGFLPARAGARRAALQSMRDARPALMFYEAPHRIVEMLEDLATVFGGERRITLGRELTKRFETVHEATLAGMNEWINADPDRQRGEFVVIVEGAPEASDDSLNSADLQMLEKLVAELPPSRAARVAADISGKPRAAFYQRAMELRSEHPAATGSDDL